MSSDDAENGRHQGGYLLPYSVLASIGVLGAPLAAAVVLAMAAPDAPPIAIVGAGMGASGLAVLAGSLLWRRKPESAVVSFEELLPWRLVARRRAERRLEAMTELLGLGGPRAAHAAAPPSLTTLYQLVTSLEAKDPYTHRHSGRVERHVRRTALYLGLNSEVVEEACRGAALHDVGKIQIPDEVLRKPGNLTAEERRVMSEHAAAGARLVSGAVSEKVAAAVRHHHERWDGAGYPDGLAGKAIPLYARLIAVADTFDALTSARPYRPGLNRAEALEILETEAGRQLDADVVAAFVESLAERRPTAMILLPAWLWRRSSLPARAVGSSAAAVAVAASIAMTTVVPPPPSDPGPRRSVEQGALGSGDEGDAPEPAVVNSAKESGERDGDRGRRREVYRAAPSDAEDATADVPDRVLETAIDGPAGADSPPAPSGGKPEPDQSGGDQAGQNPPPENPQPEKQPPPKDPPQDPQPDKGKDCPGGGNGQGQGNEKHCG